MLKTSILNLIRLYQKFISQAFGRTCRFYPSCSQYSYLAIEKYGLFVGFFLGMKRILRCHPWNQGGIDFP